MSCSTAPHPSRTRINSVFLYQTCCIDSYLSPKQGTAFLISSVAALIAVYVPGFSALLEHFYSVGSYAHTRLLGIVARNSDSEISAEIELMQQIRSLLVKAADATNRFLGHI